MSSRKVVWSLTIGFVVLLINLPLVHSRWTNYRLDSVGVTTTAEVIDTKALPEGSKDPHYFVAYRLPKDADPKRHDYSTELTKDAYEEAQRTKQVEVEYLKDNPSANRVPGQVSSNLGLWFILIADLALGMMAFLLIKFGRRPAHDLVLLATQDVARCKPGGSLQRVGTDEYVARGEVVGISDGELVLEVDAGRRVRVVLADNVNPVGYQQPAEVRGRALPKD